MSYLHISNLYKEQDILLFKECYALEKIHGTSAHISWKSGVLSFFSGGEKHDKFVALFDAAALTAKLIELFSLIGEVTIFGEAYGGKCQGMSATYGKELKFIVFDVKVGEHCWLSVPQAHDVAAKLGLEFVSYNRIPAELENIDAERDLPSVQATRNGIVDIKIREGVVLRPVIEVRKNNGERIIAKHKRAEFAERKTIPEVDPTKRQIMEDAEAIATEWVTPMRLAHVLDKLPEATDFKNIPEVVIAMIEDVTREASGEIMDNKIVRKAIGRRTVSLFKDKITRIIT